MSDGTVERSAGQPYFYLTGYDYPARDTKVNKYYPYIRIRIMCTYINLKNNFQVNDKVSLSATLEQTGYCKKMKYIADDPRCARVMITGNMLKVLLLFTPF